LIIYYFFPLRKCAQFGQSSFFLLSFFLFFSSSSPPRPALPSRAEKEKTRLILYMYSRVRTLGNKLKALGG
jgi:hypothetical protein